MVEVAGEQPGVMHEQHRLVRCGQLQQPLLDPGPHGPQVGGQAGRHLAGLAEPGVDGEHLAPVLGALGDQRPELGEELAVEIHRDHRVCPGHGLGGARQVVTAQGQCQEPAVAHRSGEFVRGHRVRVDPGLHQAPVPAHRGARRRRRPTGLRDRGPELRAGGVVLQPETGGRQRLLDPHVGQLIVEDQVGEPGAHLGQQLAHRNADVPAHPRGGL